MDTTQETDLRAALARVELACQAAEEVCAAAGMRTPMVSVSLIRRAMRGGQ